MKRLILIGLLLIAGFMAGCASTPAPRAAAPATAAPSAPIVAPAPAGDDLVASQGTDSVRLTQKPCPAGLLAMIPQELHSKVRAASAFIEGRAHAACWIAANGQVILQYDDGDSGVVPMREFRRSPGA